MTHTIKPLSALTWPEIEALAIAAAALGDAKNPFEARTKKALFFELIYTTEIANLYNLETTE